MSKPDAFMPKTPVELEITKTRVAGNLLVEYRLANLGESPIFLLNRVFDWFGWLGISTPEATTKEAAAPSHRLSYVDFEEPGCAVLWCGDAPSPRPRALQSGARTPLCTFVPAATTYQGSIELPLPLRCWHAHLAPATDTPKIAQELLLRLSYLPKEKVTRSYEHQNFPGCLVVSGGARSQVQARAKLTAPVAILTKDKG